VAVVREVVVAKVAWATNAKDVRLMAAVEKEK
jgi:hypothetical protein